MPKVLIISDSHGLTEELNEIKKRHSVKYMIHCGDSELDMDAPEMEGFIKVGGNCDIDTRYPQEQTNLIDGIRFFITHGHLHNVKFNMSSIVYRAEEENAKVICFGHTHIAGAEKSHGQLFINPGSIQLPKVRKEKTYALMEWDKPASVKVDFYTVEGKQLTELSLETSLSEESAD
ncbi:metallophosphoesterase family protein [Virgibacillus kekensis]|uniref:Phosphoesterase n=1 Tax=Virgibacillus kekensis TaxID=202261 RepID=A0ABV9DFK6_9BACI